MMAERVKTGNLKEAAAQALGEEPKRYIVQGVEVELSDDAFDDMEVVDLLDDIDGGQMTKFPKLFKALFGDDYPRIKGELGEGGRLSVTRAAEFFGELMEAANSKN